MVMVPFGAASPPVDVGDGVRGVDDQVENDLVEFPGQAEDARQVGLEVLDHVGDVFPFVGGDHQGAFHRLVEVNRDFLAAARMGKIPHGVDNAGDALDPFQGLFDGPGRFLDEKIQIALADGLFADRRPVPAWRSFP